jgi:type III pantothenate kinase
MNLLVDIGNSRLKWGLEVDQKISQSMALFHQSTNFSQHLAKNWQAFVPPKILAISSVSSDAIKWEVIGLAQQLWKDVKIIIAKSTAKAFGIQNSYLQPEKLGIDRWLALIAGYNHYQQAVWIVDCGTAITVDFINAQGQHQGGLISPGLQLMKTALSTHTATLNFSKEKRYNLGLANQTDKGIFNGTLYAATGLIEQAINQQPLKSMLILTGGDAQIIAKNLSFPVIIEPDLVLKGLALLTQK